MTPDLGDRLRALASDVAASPDAHADLVTPAVRARTLRRRLGRDAVVVASSVAVVAGVAAGAVGLTQVAPPLFAPATTGDAVPRPADVTAPSETATGSPTSSPAPAEPLEPEPVESPTAGGAPSAGPTSVPAGPPELDGLVVGADGLGPLTLGSPLPTEPAPQDMLRRDPDACAGTDAPLRWVAAYPEVARPHYPVPDAPFRVWDDGTRVTRVEVLAPGPRTAGGVQVGSSLEEARLAHPSLTRLPVGTWDIDVWAVSSGGRTLVLEVAADPDGVGRWSAAEAGTVLALVAVEGAPVEGYQPAWDGEVCG